MLGGLALFFICVISLAAKTYLRGPQKLQEKSAPSVALKPTVGLQRTQIQLPNLNRRIAGVSLRNEKQQVAIFFSLGLFARNARLKPEAEELLTELGSQLSHQITDLDVTVVGHTDDTPIRSGRRYRDNAALGLIRAVTVAEFLKTTSNLPLEAISSRGSGEEEAPFPNDSRENRARNRSVTIRISAHRPSAAQL